MRDSLIQYWCDEGYMLSSCVLMFDEMHTWLEHSVRLMQPHVMRLVQPHVCN